MGYRSGTDQSGLQSGGISGMAFLLQTVGAFPSGIRGRGLEFCVGAAEVTAQGAAGGRRSNMPQGAQGGLGDRVLVMIEVLDNDPNGADIAASAQRLDDAGLLDTLQTGCRLAQGLEDFVARDHLKGASCGIGELRVSEQGCQTAEARQSPDPGELMNQVVLTVDGGGGEGFEQLLLHPPALLGVVQ